MRLAGLVVTTLCILISFAYAAEEKEDLPARPLRIELEPIEGATGYRVEITSIDHRWQKPQIIEITSSTFRVNLSPGRYKVRTQSLVGGKPAGRRSRWLEFNVQYKPPKEIYPRPDQEVFPISDQEDEIVFEWPKAPGAVGYLFVLKDADGKVMIEKVVDKYFLPAKLAVNQKYSWSITPLSFKGEESNKSLKKRFNNFKLMAPKVSTFPAEIKLQTVTKALKYEYEFVRFITIDKTTEPSRFESVFPEFRVRLEPGEYEFRVRAIFEDKTKSDWGPPNRFYVKFPPIKVSRPRDGERLLADHPYVSEVDVKWAAQRDVKRYVVAVFDESGKLAQSVEVNDTKAKVSLPANQKYKIYVQPYNLTEQDRPLAYEFVKSEFMVRPFVYEKFAVGEEPSAFYGWAQWLTSMVQYESKNYDNNSHTLNQIWGGSGEGAIGWWHRRTRLGLLAYANLSGFDIDGDRFTYLTYGLHAGARIIRDNGDRLRLWAGWSKKVLPELVTHPGTDFLSLQEISSAGLSVQATYLRSLNSTYSIYGLISGYLQMKQGETPNDKTLNSMQSYQLSAFLSRVFSERYNGRVGYSYKLEEANYDSTVSGKTNTVYIDGHYLSFIFEFAISDPQIFDGEPK